LSWVAKGDGAGIYNILHSSLDVLPEEEEDP